MNKVLIDAAKSRLDRALTSKSDVMLALTAESLAQRKRPAWSELYYAHPTSNHAKKQLDRLLADYEKQFGAAPDALVNCINEAISAADSVLVLKAQYEKAKAARVAAKANAAQKSKAPVAFLENSVANAQVIDAVSKIAKGFKAQVKAQVAARLHSTIVAWKRKCQENPGKTDPYAFWPAEGNHFTYMCNASIRAEISHFLSYEGSLNRVYSLKPNAAAIVERRSEQYATEAIQSFVRKMCAKLAGLLDQKGDFTKVEVRGSLGQNHMHFSFADGSCFTVINDIIINRSHYGTEFNQYPTRFTDVTLSGMGTGMKGISEAWMKRNFKADRTIKFGRPVAKMAHCTNCGQAHEVGTTCPNLAEADEDDDQDRRDASAIDSNYTT